MLYCEPRPQLTANSPQLTAYHGKKTVMQQNRAIENHQVAGVDIKYVVSVRDRMVNHPK